MGYLRGGSVLSSVEDHLGHEVDSHSSVAARQCLLYATSRHRKRWAGRYVA